MATSYNPKHQGSSLGHDLQKELKTALWIALARRQIGPLLSGNAVVLVLRPHPRTVFRYGSAFRCFNQIRAGNVPGLDPAGRFPRWISIEIFILRGLLTRFRDWTVLKRTVSSVTRGRSNHHRRNMLSKVTGFTGVRRKAVDFAATVHLDRVPGGGVASAASAPSGQSREWISLQLAG